MKFGLMEMLSQKVQANNPNKRIRVIGETVEQHEKIKTNMGKYADVKIRFESQNIQDDLVFETKISDGSVPQAYFEPIERALRFAAQQGGEQGCPVIGLKATLCGGSYHPIDSNQTVFMQAAATAFNKALPKLYTKLV